MAFAAKAWQNAPSTTTPISAAALTDLETRLGVYADTKATTAFQSLNVKDMGVVGGGVVNDTTAINNAIITASALPGLTRLFFPDDVYLTDSILVLSNVWLDFGSSTIRKRVNGTGGTTNSLLRALPVEVGGTYYGTYSNIKVTGGFFDLNGKTAPAHIISLIFVDGLEIDRVTVTHDPANLTWAMCVGGRNGSVTNCRVLGGTATFQDGIHLYHGQYWRIENNYIECGDDAIALGGEPSDAVLLSDADSIRYVAATNNVVKSAKGNAFKCYVQSGATGTDWQVTDVAVHGLSGTSGTTRNGGVVIIDNNNGVAGTSQIKRVNVDGVKLKIGSTSHDEVNAFCVWVQSVSDLAMSNMSIEFTEKSPVVAGMDLCVIRDSEDVKLDGLRCNALGKRYGVDARRTNRLTVVNSKLRYVAGTNAPVYLEDAVNFKFHGNDILDIPDAGSGILIIAGTTTAGVISGNTFKQVGGFASGQAVGVGSTAFAHLTIVDNDFLSVFAGVNTSALLSGASFIVKGNRSYSDLARTVTVPTIASAANIVPSLLSDVMIVSGTTNITSITAQAGRRITLIFTGTAASTGLTAGSNLKIPANFVWTANDTYTLACDGTNWCAVGSGTVNP